MGCRLTGVHSAELGPPVVHEAPSLREETPTSPLAASPPQKAVDFVEKASKCKCRLIPVVYLLR